MSDSPLQDIEYLLARLHEQAQEIERLRAQALAISASLAEFRIGPCSLPQGVIELGQRAEAAEAKAHEQAQEIERLKDELMEVQSQVTLYWKKASESFEHFQRAEAAEARLRDLEGRTDDGPQPEQPRP